MGRRRQINSYPLRLSILFAIFLFVWAFYIKEIYLRPTASSMLSTFLRDVFPESRIDIGTIDLLPNGSIACRDLSIYDSNHNPAKLVFRSSKITLNMSILSLYGKSKKVSISKIVVENPSFIISKRKDGTLNILSPPIFNVNYLRMQKAPFKLGRLFLHRGNFYFVSAENNKSSILSITDINGFMDISKIKSELLFDVSFLINGQSPTTGHLKGSYAYPKNTPTVVKGQLKLSSLDFNDAKKFLPQFKLGNIIDGILDINYDFEIINNRLLGARGKIDWKNFTLENSLTKITGESQIATITHYDFKNNAFTYQNIQAKWRNSTIYFPKKDIHIRQISGETIIANNNLIIPYLVGTWNSDSITAYGIIKNVRTNPYLLVNTNHYVNLKNTKIYLKQFYPDINEPFSLSGKAEIISRLEANTMNNNLKDILLSGKAHFKNVSASIKDKTNLITNLTGEVEFNNGQYTIDQIKFDFGDIKNILSGHIRKKDASHLKVASGLYRASANFKIDEDLHLIRVNSLWGEYKNSDFNIEGVIKNRNGFPFNLKCELNADINDFESWVTPDLLKQFNLNGFVNTLTESSGSLNSLNKSSHQIYLKSDGVSIDSLYLSNLSSNITINNGLLENGSLKSLLYGGDLIVNWNRKLYGGENIYATSLYLDSLNLFRLTSNIEKIKSEASGLLSSHFSLSWPIKDWKKIAGEGHIEIIEGNLGSLPFVNPLLLPFESVFFGYKSNTLREAYGNFAIRNGRFYTDNLTFWGNHASLKCHGSGNFDGKINFVVENSLSEGLKEREEGSSNFFGTIFDKTRKMLGKTRIEGTLSDPSIHYSLLN